jgi:hypothetical protein
MNQPTWSDESLKKAHAFGEPHCATCKCFPEPPYVREYTKDPKNCAHGHTGSCSPHGVYLYASCGDCGDIVHETAEGRKRREACSGYESDGVAGRYSLCKHCSHDYAFHLRTT